MIFKFFAKIGILFIVFLNLSYADKNENYEIFFDKMEVINGGDILAADFKVEKTGSSHFNVNGIVENFEQFDDEWEMNLQVSKSKSADGEYRTLIRYTSKDKKGICLVLKNEYKKYFYESLKDYSNAPHYDTCPLIPSKYTITNYPFDAGVFKKYFSPGYFRITMFFSSPLEPDVIQYDIYIHIEDVK